MRSAASAFRDPFEALSRALIGLHGATLQRRAPRAMLRPSKLMRVHAQGMGASSIGNDWPRRACLARVCFQQGERFVRSWTSPTSGECVTPGFGVRVLGVTIGLAQLGLEPLRVG